MDVPRVKITGGHWSLGPAREQIEREALPEFLLRQRWFAGKARTVRQVRLVSATAPGALPGSLVLAVADVAFQDGGHDRYLLPLSVSSGAQADRLADDLRFRVALLETPDGPARLHDALADPGSCRALLDWLSASQKVEAGQAALQGVTTDAFSGARGPIDAPLPVKISRAEQSNSSVIFGDRLILKLFRRLEPGLNPDFEIGRYLTEQTPFDRIPRTAGAIELIGPGQEPTTLAILQALVPNQGTGWEHALAQLDDYYSRVQKTARTAPSESRPPLGLAQEPVPEELTTLLGPALDDAETLGRRTAEMHLALGSETNDPAFRPEPFTRENYKALAGDIRGQVERSLDLLKSSLDRLSGPALEDARQVLGRSSDLLARLEELTSRSPDVEAVRVHGDYHLGQVLRVQDDYVILDFEGEPARPLAKRREKQLAVKDVVGMLRSFDYAAYAALFAVSANNPEATTKLSPWARAWSTWTSAAFLRAYLGQARSSRFLPRSDDGLRLLLDAFTIDKTLYELLYELNNRPDWVRIPLQGVLAILDGQDQDGAQRPEAQTRKTP